MNKEHADRCRAPLSSAPDPRRSLLLLISVAVATVGGSIVLWVSYQMLAGPSRQRTQKEFGWIWISLHCYDLNRQRLPYPLVRDLEGEPYASVDVTDTGTPLYAWRGDLIPFLESWHGDRNCSQPWNSPANDEARKHFAPFFSYAQPVFQERDAEANALAITGPGTAWGDGEERPKSLKEIPPATILVVEVRSSGILWMQPGDFDIRTMPHTVNAPDGKGISSRHAGGFHVIFADGKVWFVSDKVPFATLKKFFTVADAASSDREKELGPYVLDRGPSW